MKQLKKHSGFTATTDLLIALSALSVLSLIGLNQYDNITARAQVLEGYTLGAKMAQEMIDYQNTFGTPGKDTNITGMLPVLAPIDINAAGSANTPTDVEIDTGVIEQDADNKIITSGFYTNSVAHIGGGVIEVRMSDHHITPDNTLTKNAVSSRLTGLAFPSQVYVAGKKLSFIPYALGTSGSGYIRYQCITNMDLSNNLQSQGSNYDGNANNLLSMSAYAPHCIALNNTTYEAVRDVHKVMEDPDQIF